MKTQIVILMVASWVIMVLMPAGVFAGSNPGTMDNERVIDVESLQFVLEKSTNEIGSRVEKTQLLSKFEEATKICQEKQVDKKKMLGALNGLTDAIDDFCADYNRMTDPIWEGQDQLSKTIEKVQLLLAKSGTGEPSERSKKFIENYDSRLSSLAKRIKQETNESRKKQLEIVFANVLSLKNLYSNVGRLTLTETTEAMYIEIIKTLSNLEVALTNAVFELERTKIVLESQADFVREYTGILQGMIDAEDLAKVLAKLKSNGPAGGFNLGLGELTEALKGFESAMLNAVQQSNQSIMESTVGLTDAPDLGQDVDINKMIEQYSKM